MDIAGIELSSVILIQTNYGENRNAMHKTAKQVEEKWDDVINEQNYNSTS